MTEHWQPDEAMAAFAELDHDRARRRGYPEAVYCEGKTPGQVSAIAGALKGSPATALFARADPAHAGAILAVLPDARYDEEARMLAWPPEPPAPQGGGVLVVAAGTADLGVAREAQLTAQYLGRAADLIVDVGIAGLHRILARLGQLRSARVIVVVAGMDGALPGLVAGLVCAFPRETVAIYDLAQAGRMSEAREIYRWFMPLLHLDVSLRFVQNIKLVEHLVRGTSPAVRAPRLELIGAEKAAVEAVVAAALQTRPDLARLASKGR